MNPAWSKLPCAALCLFMCIIQKSVWFESWGPIPPSIFSHFYSYHSKIESELSCIYEHFRLFWKLFSSPPVVSSTIWRLFFCCCSLCWDIQFLGVLFLSFERKFVLHMKGIGKKSCQSKLVQKVLAVMPHSKHTAESLWGTSVFQVAEFTANRSSK